jgi:uncharacterized metal-binding protein/predicted Fe-Mo cluster-binding NifX family protein
MRYGIPIIEDRVAPRCTCADALLTVVSNRGDVHRERTAILPGHTLIDLVKTLTSCHVDTVICGGINREGKEFLRAKNFKIIDNVASTVDRVIDALRTRSLSSGFGFSNASNRFDSESAEVPVAAGSDSERPSFETASAPSDGEDRKLVDCLSCQDRVCLEGKVCDVLKTLPSIPLPDSETTRMLEAALDITCEEERTLCRLSELIYFCLEMGYGRIGVAYCEDLREPTLILVHVLRRFLDVVPVSCKVGGAALVDPLVATAADIDPKTGTKVACNPQGQAKLLSMMDTDLNVAIGLCMGADCVFSRASTAPVTTLFVKDRSLANNPIGAVYSDHYLREAMEATQAIAERRNNREM